MFFNYKKLPFTFDIVNDADANTIVIFSGVEFTQDFGIFKAGDRFSEIQMCDGALEVWENDTLVQYQGFTIAPD